VYTGRDLLRPAWDVFGSIWVVDRRPSGATVVVLTDGRARRLKVPGLTGQDVDAFELSRDGTRIAAVVDGQVVLARIGRQENGRPHRALNPVDIPVGTQAGSVLDLGWAEPATLGVLTRRNPDSSQVVLAGIDGSFALDVGSRTVEPLFEVADDLVTWPGAEAPLLLHARTGRAYQVSAAGRWNVASLPPDLVAPTFAG
jgi:hypothetical protein